MPGQQGARKFVSQQYLGIFFGPYDPQYHLTGIGIVHYNWIFNEIVKYNQISPAFINLMWATYSNV